MAGLERVREEIGVISNVRGRGLFVACDLPDTAQRNRLVTDLRKRERVILLPCGERSIRFRPALSVEDDRDRRGRWCAGPVADPAGRKGDAGVNCTERRNPRAGFIGDPRAGLFYHPVVVDGARPGDRLFILG